MYSDAFWGSIFCCQYPGVLLFIFGPVVASFILSFTRWDLLTPWNGLGDKL